MAVFIAVVVVTAQLSLTPRAETLNSWQTFHSANPLLLSLTPPPKMHTRFSARARARSRAGKTQPRRYCACVYARTARACAHARKGQQRKLPFRSRADPAGLGIQTALQSSQLTNACRHPVMSLGFG